MHTRIEAEGIVFHGRLQIPVAVIRRAVNRSGEISPRETPNCASWLMLMRCTVSAALKKQRVFEVTELKSPTLQVEV